MTSCGPSGSESCCASLQVPGGTYNRTYDPLGHDGGPYIGRDGSPVGGDPSTTSGFRLDKYEVTVGRFRQFADAHARGSGWTPPAGSGKHVHLNGGRGLVSVGGDSGVAYEPGWIASDNANIAATGADRVKSCDGPTFATWTAAPAGNENLPINCLNWYEAYAFCIWDGGFLPSESEWEYAAAGGSQQRDYPWGSTAPGTDNRHAIYGAFNNDIVTCYYPSSGVCTGVVNIAPVGTATLGAGLWGQVDLAGNVWEWNLDFVPSYAAPGGYVDPCVDCYYGATTAGRCIRGGDFMSSLAYMYPPYRENSAPAFRGEGFGVRCARTP